MKRITVLVTVVDETGAAFEGSATLSASHKKTNKKEGAAPRARELSPTLSFEMNPRAFMKAFGRKRSGSEKFVLLVARLVEGRIGETISSKSVVVQWNRMKALMDGPWNPAYATRAKDYGWVDSPKYGFYALSDTWSQSYSK